ncbi:MAG: GNAT family N-acetyltransferase [Solirubrobacteraceae bacterium]|nr:GNAT family N-acetyltransferase [Solirubrobacteraceae bacterium]
MSGLAFRFASAADASSIVALVESAYRGEASLAGWTTEAHLIGGQRTDAEMVAEALVRPGAHLLLAELGGALVACCELNAPARAAASAPDHGCAPGHSPAGTAYFGMFAVDPTRQSAGLGKRVLAEAERVAHDELGAAQLEMTVIRQREELVAWYERRGYAQTGELRAFPYGDERFGLPKRDDLEMVVLSKTL